MVKLFFRFIGLAMVSTLVGSTALAQYYYPSASFFLPSAHLIRTFNKDTISWLESKDFQTLAFLLGMAGLDEQLKPEGNPITLFAPTDKAFAKLPGELREKLSQPEELQRLLKYHLVSRLITEADLKRREVATLEGSSVQITGTPLPNNAIEIRLNEAVAKRAIGLNENFIIIVIDQVLLPPDF